MFTEQFITSIASCLEENIVDSHEIPVRIKLVDSISNYVNQRLVSMERDIVVDIPQKYPPISVRMSAHIS